MGGNEAGNVDAAAVAKVSPFIRSPYGSNTSGATPRTPLGSSSLTGQYEYFPPSFPLSPSASVRQAPSTAAYSSTALSSPSIRSVAGAGLLTPVQNIATPLSRQVTVTAQPGTAAIMTDANSSTTNVQAHALERNELHKALRSLEGLLLVVDEYKDLKCRLAKCEKRMTKSLEEMTKSKAFEHVPSKTLQAASSIYEAKAEVSSKQAKMIQKEYEALNEHCAKYFKRVAKEERSFDEQLDALDSKIKKANASHDKGAKKSSKAALESHDKFIQAMQALTNEVARLKSTHSSSVGTKTFVTSLMVAATVGGLADAEFKTSCESVRRSGQHIGNLHEWFNFTVNDAMANCQPPDLGEDGIGLGQKIVAKEEEIREELRRQEGIRLKQLEEEHAMLKLQQMGWIPPTLQRQATTLDVVEKKSNNRVTEGKPDGDLPKLDSNGNLVESTSKKQPTSSRKEESKTKDISHHQAASSSAEGTVIIKDPELERGTIKGTAVITEEPEEEERASVGTPALSTDGSGTSLSATSSNTASAPNENHSKGSEDSTPPLSDSRSSGPLTPIEEQADSVIIKSAETDDVQKMSASIENKRILLNTTPGMPLCEQTHVQASSAPKPIVERNRTSLWQRNAEEDRQHELERRLLEAEKRLRLMEESDPKDVAYTERRQSPKQDRQPYSKPRHSDQPLQQTYEQNRSTSRAQVQHQSRIDPVYEVDEGIARSTSAQEGGVTRSLSTDSERSFVARMRAIYQADKAESQQREQQSQRRSGGVGATTSSRRVSDQGYATYTRYDDRTTFNNGGGRGTESSPPAHQARMRHDSAPAYPQSASRPKTAAAEPPHAKSCGCWNCSARHYRTADQPAATTTGASIAMAQTSAGIVPPHPPPRHPTATLTSREQALLAQHRRQTMQVLPDEHMYSTKDKGDRTFGLVAPPHQLYGRRSFEDEPQRRTVLAEKNFGTVR